MIPIPNLESTILQDPSPSPKSEQTIIALCFIVHMKLVMMCTDDAVVSLNGTCQHWPQEWETCGRKQGTLINKSKRWT